MTKTHFLMRPTCPNDVLPAGLVCSVVKGLNGPQQGIQGLSGPAVCSLPHLLINADDSEVTQRLSAAFLCLVKSEDHLTEVNIEELKHESRLPVFCVSESWA